MTEYDAVLLASFGGPEGPSDVLPFLENVTRGRAVPPERLARVAAQYARCGGVSPINGHNRALVEALRGRLDLPVYWGNLHWTPLLADTVARMRDDGVRRALALVTSAYSSYPGCRAYREAIAAAVGAAGPGAPVIDQARRYFDHPGFVEPFVAATAQALGRLPAEVRARARLVFTTHSLPLALAQSSGPAGGAYVAQHEVVARLVAEGVATQTAVRYDWDLVFQSRSGPPDQPWLGPDVRDHLVALQAAGVPGVVVVPVGFVSDHMEVVYDLDVLARETADRVGLPMARASTPGTDPRFADLLADLVRERRDDVPASGRRALSPLGPWADTCPGTCCPAPAPALGPAPGRPR